MSPKLFSGEFAKPMILLAFSGKLFSGNGRFWGWNLFFPGSKGAFFRLERVLLMAGFPFALVWQGAVDGGFPVRHPSQVRFSF